MYPSINNALGMEACRKGLDNREKLKEKKIDCLMEAIEFTLENNNCTFNGKHYLQIDGTAMGPKNACSYADISVSDIDNKVFEHEYLQPLCMIKIFMGEGVVDGEGGSSERCLKWGGGGH